VNCRRLRTNDICSRRATEKRQERAIQSDPDERLTTVEASPGLDIFPIRQPTIILVCNRNGYETGIAQQLPEAIRSQSLPNAKVQVEYCTKGLWVGKVTVTK
jgi:hypothetical protein